MKNENSKNDLQLLLELLFDSHETVCSSPTVYASHSKSQFDVSTDDAFLTVNPINGFRRVADVTSFRSFLVEVDPKGWDQLNEHERSRLLDWQRSYIDRSGLPVSACIFSGNKSLHYLVVLDEPFRDNEDHKFHFRWIANVLEEVDVQAGNAIAGVRVPGHTRLETGKLQRLDSIGIRIAKTDFLAFLERHPDAKPRGKTPEQRRTSQTYAYEDHDPRPGEYGRLSRRALQFLECGAPQGEWHREFIFTVKDLKAQNYSIEEAEEMLTQIEGDLDDKDMKQLRYGYENDSFEMSFRPFENRCEGGDDGGEE